MAPRPHLTMTAAPPKPRGVVLVLHGGREASTMSTRATQLAVLRMIPFAHRIAEVGAGELAVARLRFAVRGWNEPDESPVTDARWALDELTRRFGDRPIGLVGHSMGGRTALRVAGHEQVRSVVGLAPWLPRGEPLAQLAGRDVLLVHGTADRMTSPRGSAATVAALQQAGVDAALIDIPGEKHSMLHQPRLWHDLAAGFTVGTLLGSRPADGTDQRQSISAQATNLLQHAANARPEKPCHPEKDVHD